MEYSEHILPVVEGKCLPQCKWVLEDGKWKKVWWYPEPEERTMPDRENVIRELRDIDMFIAGRLEYEKAKNFLRTIDETIVLLKEQEGTINELQNAYGYLQKQFFEAQDELLKEQEARIEQLNRFVNGFSRDAMPVVRCKDCKKRNISECPLHYGGHTENDTDDDWFCADRERRTDDA